MNILKTISLSLLLLASFQTMAFPVTIEARLRILEKNSDEAIVTKANLDTIKAFILQQGLRETYCNMYNNNPTYRTSNFAFYLNPDSGQANINCDPAKSDFNNLTIRSIQSDRNQYRSIEFANEVYVLASWPSEEMTVGQIRKMATDALKEIMTAIQSAQQGGGAVRLTRGTPIAEPIVAPEFGAPHR
jgi:hypothetical protein